MRGKTILVVDDEPHIRHMLEYKLTKAGCTVHTASNGQTAFDLALEHIPDLVVTDYQMPGADGMEFCTRLRNTAETAEIPALLLTARGYKVPTTDLARTNIKSLIAKPFSPRELLAQIEELLGDLGSSTDEDRGSTAA